MPHLIDISDSEFHMEYIRCANIVLALTLAISQ
jgi:hypothetical protein